MPSEKRGTIQGLLFDLDGTLVDSAPDIAAAANVLLKAHDKEPLTVDDIRLMIGNGVKALVKRAFAKRGVDLDEANLDARNEEMMAIYAKNLTVLTTVMPGADKTLDRYKQSGMKLAVVTNKPEKFSREICSYFGWDTVLDAIVGGDTCDDRKPAPGMLFHACKQMGVDPANCVMIGDSPADIDSAKNAGMRSVAVRGGYTTIPVDDLGAGMVIDTLAALPDAVTALKNLP